MSNKAGLTLLLTFSLFFVSGVINKTFAQEKLTLLQTETKKGTVCNTLLQNYLIPAGEKCEIKIVSQTDSVQKLSVKSKSSIAYATEPTYYASEQIIKPTVQTPTVAPSIEPQNPNVPVSNLGANGNSNNSDAIFEMINAHRAKIGKPSFLKDGALCTLATTRSLELHNELFVTGGLHSGLYNRNLPYWITENAKYGSNEAGTVQWWLNSPVHRSAIEGNYTYSCGACNGTQCAQLFTSYTPKGRPVASPIEAVSAEPLAATN